VTTTSPMTTPEMVVAIAKNPGTESSCGGPTNGAAGNSAAKHPAITGQLRVLRVRPPIASTPKHPGTPAGRSATQSRSLPATVKGSHRRPHGRP
jgi:hypothetical protein